MGFFSSLGRALTNVKRAACRGVGKVIEKVGEITITHILKSKLI